LPATSAVKERPGVTAHVIGIAFAKRSAPAQLAEADSGRGNASRATASRQPRTFEPTAEHRAPCERLDAKCCRLNDLPGRCRTPALGTLKQLGREAG
jgi:hypothetical protein